MTIYVVTCPNDETRLVRAGSKAAAIKHVTAPEYTAEPASIDDMARYMAIGIKVEDAKVALPVAGAAS